MRSDTVFMCPYDPVPWEEIFRSGAFGRFGSIDLALRLGVVWATLYINCWLSFFWYLRLGLGSFMAASNYDCDVWVVNRFRFQIEDLRSE